MTLIEQMVRSPKLPQYMQELESILEAEHERRQRFFDELREDQKAEFINGEVIVPSPVTLEHDDISSRVHMLFKTYVDLHSLGYVGHEKLLISLTRNDYEPDVCYFHSSRSAKFKRKQRKFPAPDLIVEVLAPSTEHIDRGIKFEDYAAHDVEEYWLIDPDKRTIEQYLLSGKRYELKQKARTGTLRSRAIKGFEMPVRAAFDVKAHLRALAEILAE